MGEARPVKVRYTRTVLRRIDAAATFLKPQNPPAARGLQEGILAVVARLRTHPHSARETSRRNIRRLPPGTYPYLLDCSVEKDEIMLRRFRHTSRRPLA